MLMMFGDAASALVHGIFASLAYAFHKPAWLQWYSAIWFFVCGAMAYKFWRKVTGRG